MVITWQKHTIDNLYYLLTVPNNDVILKKFASLWGTDSRTTVSYEARKAKKENQTVDRGQDKYESKHTGLRDN